MEFRKYSTGVWPTDPDTLNDEEAQNSDKSSKFLRKAIYLPPRSMLLLSGEARYAWHHYIPHHKVTLHILDDGFNIYLFFCGYDLASNMLKVLL